MDGPHSDDSKQNPTDMTAFVQNLLQQMQTRFQTMSESIVAKIDEMDNRIDELERSIKDLKAEMEPEDPPSLAPSSNSKPDEVNKEETTE